MYYHILQAPDISLGKVSLRWLPTIRICKWSKLHKPPIRILLASVCITSTKSASPGSKRTNSGVFWNKGCAGSKAVIRPNFPASRFIEINFSPAYPAIWAPKEWPMIWKSCNLAFLYIWKNKYRYVICNFKRHMMTYKIRNNSIRFSDWNPKENQSLWIHH